VRAVGPALSNTRVCDTSCDGDGLVAGLHYLTFTVRGDQVAAVLAALVGVGAGEFHEANRGTSMYRRRWDGPHGATVEAGFRLGGSDHVRVNLPGDACEVVGFLRAVDLVDALQARVTRWDGALDGAGFDPIALADAWDAGHIRSKLRRDDEDACRLYRNGAGTTVYLGSPSSDRMLRCYDRRGPVRVELQMRREMAAASWAAVAVDPSAFGTVLLGLVGGFVEVAAPVGADTNRSRWQRLPWWDAFMSGATALVGLVKRTPATFTGLVGHIWRNAAALATYVDGVAGFGHDEAGVLAALLSGGRARRHSRHRAMLGGVLAAASG
jgi:hypothetical protein